MAKLDRILDAIWDATEKGEEPTALEWMCEVLRKRGYLVFDGDDEARDWALKYTDLVEG